MSTTAPSVQLYTVRESFERDPLGTLERLAGLGFTRVEPYRLTDFEAPLQEARARFGLAIPTAHCRLVGADQVAVFAAARRLGVGTVVDPRVPAERWRDGAGIGEVAALLEDAAQVGADAGVAVGYHNHAFELQLRVDGRTALEVLAELAPSVGIELDLYWAAVGGADPVALARAFGDRLVALHLKDGPVTDDVADQVPLGEGVLPVREVLAAAPSALRVLELDDSRVELFDALARGLAYLRVHG